MNKPASSKLFNSKTWLALPDAAKRLSSICGEGVTEADILQLALDKHLELSVKFINPVKAMRGKVVGYEDAEWKEIPTEDVDMFEEGEINNYTVSENGKVFELKSVDLGDGRFLNLTPGVITIPNGILDLPMIGYSRIAVECKYQELIGGPAIDLSRHLPKADIDGVFVEDLDGSMFRLQISFEDVEEYPGSRAQLDKLINFIMYSGVSDEDAEELRIEYSENRKKLIRKLASEPDSQTHFMADTLPEDSVFVVRTDALSEFKLPLVADNDGKIDGNGRRPPQIKLLLSEIDALGTGRFNIPVGKKQDVLKECLKSKVFSSESVFKRVWSELSVSGQISIEGKENFL